MEAQFFTFESQHAAPSASELQQLILELTPPTSPSAKKPTLSKATTSIPPLVDSKFSMINKKSHSFNLDFSSTFSELNDDGLVLPNDDCLLSLPKDDCVTFNELSMALSRALTPPPESLPPTPCQSGFNSPMMTTPSSSRPSSPSCLDDLINSGTCADADTGLSLDDALTCDSLDSVFGMPTSLFQDIMRDSKSSDDLLPTILEDDEPAAKRPKLATSSKPAVAPISKKASSSAKKPEEHAPVPLVGPDGKPLSKRDAHNVSERQRRLALKKSFDVLRSVVPAIANSPRVHTGQILKEAVDYIRKLQAEEKALIDAKQEIQAQNARIRQSMLASL